MSFFRGTPERWEQRSTLNPQQRPIESQLYGAAQGPGAGGAFGSAADYYRGLLSDNNSTFNAFAAPEQRRFQQETIPGLAEQFAGMGSGGLSSSGFRNAAVSAGTDLAERLGAIRAQLRQQGAQGLMGLGQQALQPYQENILRPGTEGFLSSAIGPALGAIGTAVGGPVLGAIGTAAGGWLKNSLKGKSSWKGEQGQEGPTNLRYSQPGYMRGM